MGLGLGLGIWWPIQTSIIPGILKPLKVRATYFENVRCTTATLKKIENIPYTPPPPPTGILLVDYPGASAAYSLRNLIDTTTNVVRVRRSSDNTEQDFSATQITDGTLTTFTGSGDGLVAIWYDQSGNSNNALQPTASEQPKLVSSGVVELENGKSALKTSVNTYFTITDFLNAQPFTFFAVNKAITRGPLIGGVSFRVLGKRYTGAFIAYCGAKLVGGVYPTDQNLFTTKIDGSNSEIFSNSNLIVTGNAGNQTPFTFLLRSSDSNGGLDGTIQEIIIYPSDQTSNKTGIETNINNEYTIY